MSYTKGMTMTNKTLKDLLVSFKDNEIGKLPKPTKKQTDEVKSNFKSGIRCKDCGGWHHPKVVHLDYIGHAALTKRLLEVDPTWDWEPMALVDGLPAFDKTGGLWIKLTILGTTRLGYGNAPPKGEAGNREKEVIGDALRNAGMRFGMGLDLWHKGDLFLEDETPEPVKEAPKPEPKKTKLPTANDYKEVWRKWIDKGFGAGKIDAVKVHIESIKWLKPEDETKVKEYFTNKLQENK